MTKTWEEEFEKNIHVSSDMMTGNKYCSVNQVKGLGHGWVAPEDHQAEVEAIKSQLQQQALPVVPECVGELFNEYRFENIQRLFEFGIDDIKSNKMIKALKWRDEHPDIFALAFITGRYEVEKPQQKRYEVKLLSGESMYFNPIGNPKNIKDYRFSFGNYAGWKTQFTKSELAEIKDGMFLKRIPGGTPLDDLGKDKSYYVWIEDCNYWKNPFIELVPVEDGE